jgi:hypothetical protein
MMGAPPQVATQRLLPEYELSADVVALCAPADVQIVAKIKASPAVQNRASVLVVGVECLIAVSFCEMRRVCEARPGAGRTTCGHFDTTTVDLSPEPGRVIKLLRS